MKFYHEYFFRCSRISKLSSPRVFFLSVTGIGPRTGRGTARIEFLFENKMRKFSSEVPTVNFFQDKGNYCENPGVDDVNTVLVVLARD